MKLIFVHGWSVTHTNTYGDLPRSLSAHGADHGLTIDIEHIHLGKYVSFDDEVSIDDIARAFDYALRQLPGNDPIQPFSCITHSTGGPVIRHWIDKYYGARKLKQLPLQHAIMLAPANHGSSLAILGKARVGRLKAWFNRVEPGQRVLDWLCLGSEGQWQLNEAWLNYNPVTHGFYPFVLTGQGIDKKLYDFLNSYLVENGSDGVVRVAGANLNYRLLSLEQEGGHDAKNSPSRLTYNARKPVRHSKTTALGVFSCFSHSQKKMGILCVDKKQSTHPLIVHEILKCLSVNSADRYQQRTDELAMLTAQEQLKAPVGKDHPVGRYSMLVFRIRDDAGNMLTKDQFDLVLLAGPNYQPDKLPKGFFVDRQLNPKSHSLVYYVDADSMSQLKDGHFGIRIIARPEKGLVRYHPAEFRSEGKVKAEQVFSANETTYIDITLKRLVDENVFRLSPAKGRHHSFKNTGPSGTTID